MTTYILDHSSLDRVLVEEFVNRNLYCSDHFLYSICLWNEETIVSRGILFKVTVLDERPQREMIHKSLKEWYATR